MLETFGIKDEYLFKVAVIATMSSGKSTFINALVGKDLLLSRNEACSARVISILDNDQNKEEKVYVEYADGSFEKGRDLTQEYMEVINSDERIDKVLIETHIDGIKNTDRAMVIIDTPGVNNSMDNSHREKTMELIHRLDEGLIIYLLNATQLGVEDDQSFLLEIAELVNESNDQLKIMFAINKIDEVDEEKESIAQVMENAHAYLVNAGIKNPQIYPVSSLACKLFRRGINEESFSRKEMSDFRRFYNTFAPRGFDPSRYIVADEYDQRNKKVTVGKEEFLCRDLYAAIDNTGMTHIENAIEDYMAESGKIYTPKIDLQEITYSDGEGFEIESGYIRKCPQNVVPYNALYQDGISSACFDGKRCTQCSYQKKCCVVLKEKDLAWVYIRPKLQISFISTMSSGKTTLINALLETDLLPSKNEASTTTIMRIHNNNHMNTFNCVCRNVDGEIIASQDNVIQADLAKCYEQVLKMGNDDPSKIIFLDLEGPIPGIESKKMHVYLQDTSSSNGALGLRHKKSTEEAINDQKNSVILYVMNATQLRVPDDYNLLKKISSAINSGGKEARDRFIFVINKFDELDLEKEDSEKIIQSTKDYLKEFGIHQPNIFPISARAALLLRKEHNGEPLSHIEKRELQVYKFDFSDPDFILAHFEKYASLSQAGKKELEDRLAKADEYETALIHTGVPALEEAINEYIRNFSFSQKNTEDTEIKNDSNVVGNSLGVFSALISALSNIKKESEKTDVHSKASTAKSYFIIQNNAITSCVEGYTPTWSYRYESDHRLVAKFNLDDCMFCPKRNLCGAELKDQYSWVEFYENDTVTPSVAAQFTFDSSGYVQHCPRGCIPLQAYTDGRAAFNANTCRLCGNKDSCGVVLTDSDIVWVQVKKQDKRDEKSFTKTSSKSNSIRNSYDKSKTASKSYFIVENNTIKACKRGRRPMWSYNYERENRLVAKFSLEDCMYCPWHSQCGVQLVDTYNWVELVDVVQQNSVPQKETVKYIKGFTIEDHKIIRCKTGCRPFRCEYQDGTIIGYFDMKDCTTCSAFMETCPAKYGINCQVVRLKD